MNTTCRTLLEACEGLPTNLDTTAVENDVRHANSRYDKLHRANFEVERKARVVEQSVEVYQKALEPVQVTYSEVESYLECAPEIGLDVDKGKEELRRVDVRFLFSSTMSL